MQVKMNRIRSYHEGRVLGGKGLLGLGQSLLLRLGVDDALLGLGELILAGGELVPLLLLRVREGGQLPLGHLQLLPGPGGGVLHELDLGGGLVEGVLVHGPLLLDGGQLLRLLLELDAELIGLALDLLEDVLELGILLGLGLLALDELLLEGGDGLLGLGGLGGGLGLLLLLGLDLGLELLHLGLLGLDVLLELDVLPLVGGELLLGLLELGMDLVVLGRLGGDAGLDLGHALVGAADPDALLLELGLDLLPLLRGLLGVGIGGHHVDLIQHVLLPADLPLLGQEGLGLELGPLQALLLLLDGLDAVELLLPLLGQRLDLGRGLLGVVEELVGADDVLQILEEAVVVLGLALGGHHGDHLDLALQDEEAVVVEVDALGVQVLGHVLEGAVLPVELVAGRVVPAGDAGDDDLAAGDDVVVLVGVAGVDDLVEVDRDAGVLEGIVLEGVGGVDQLGHLVEAELLGALAEDEEHGVDDVGLAGSVGTDDRGEAFVERPDLPLPGVRLEVLQDLRIYLFVCMYDKGGWIGERWDVDENISREGIELWMCQI